MEAGVDRREFLKYSMATGVLMAAGELKMADGSVQGAITEVDKLTIWVLADNTYDTLRPDTKIAKRYRSVPGKAILAEHGLSLYVETVVNGATSTCMFDYGHDSMTVMHNIGLLGLDVAKTTAFSLSHGHWDHFTAAVGIISRNQARIAKGTPFFVGEEAFARRYSRRPGATEAADLGQLNREDLEALGLKIVEVKSATQIIPGAYFTGNIERVTPYEKVPQSLLIKRGEVQEPDDFRGEQGLFFKVKGKGLVVISGCAHAGIVNTVRQAQKLAGTDKIHALMGGCHLANAKHEIIQSTVADVKAMKPDYVIPMHCTGFEAVTAFAKEMPEQFTLNTAGTRYTFGG